MEILGSTIAATAQVLCKLNSQHRRYQALASQSHPITWRKQSQYRRSQTVYDADYPDLTEKTFPNIVGARL